MKTYIPPIPGVAPTKTNELAYNARVFLNSPGMDEVNLPLLAATYLALSLFRNGRDFYLTTEKGEDIATLRNGEVQCSQDFAGYINLLDTFIKQERTAAVNQVLDQMQADLALKEAAQAEPQAPRAEESSAQRPQNQSQGQPRRSHNGNNQRRN